MTPAERFEKLQADHPTPWRVVCEYLAGDYIPHHIIDSNGNKVMDCAWGAATETGKHVYACIVEATKDRVNYGNPWTPPAAKADNG